MADFIFHNKSKSSSDTVIVIVGESKCPINHLGSALSESCSYKRMTPFCRSIVERRHKSWGSELTATQC